MSHDIKFCFLFQTDVASLLRKSIKVHTETAVREAIHLVCIIRKYNKLRQGHKNEGGTPLVLLLFDNGYFTTVSGWGQIFETFA